MAVPKFTSASALKSVKMSVKSVSRQTKASLRILDLLLNNITAKVAYRGSQKIISMTPRTPKMPEETTESGKNRK